MDEAILCKWLSRFEGERANYRQVLALAGQTFKVFDSVLGPDHRHTLAIRNNIATSTGGAVDARKALRLFQTLLSDRLHVLGKQK